MPLRIGYFCSVSKLQPTLWMASSHCKSFEFFYQRISVICVFCKGIRQNDKSSKFAFILPIPMLFQFLGLQDPGGLQPEDIQQPRVRRSVDPVGQCWLRGGLPGLIN